MHLLKHFIVNTGLPLKNKTKTYLLIAAVLGIWGTVAYQFFSGISPKTSQVVEAPSASTFKPQTQKPIDTFSVTEVARDPFLGTLKQKRVSTNKLRSKKRDTINQPHIVYKGLVKRQETNQQVFVIDIDNTQYLLKKGQTVKSVTLLKGDSEKISVRFNNMNMTIPIQ